MPNLPTITVADPGYTRLIKAFNSDPVEYKAWLRKTLREEVTLRELRVLTTDQNAAQAAIIADLSTNVLPEA